MSEKNHNDEWGEKWEKRPLEKPSSTPQSNGTKPLLDSRWNEIRDSLPPDMVELFDELVDSYLKPRPK